MPFDYSLLDGLITQKFGSRAAFAKEIGISEHSISVKMNGKTPWKQADICKACDILNIDITDIHKYFFTEKVQNH